MIFGVKTLLYLVRKRYFLLLKIWCENDNIWCENDISSEQRNEKSAKKHFFLKVKVMKELKHLSSHDIKTTQLKLTIC